MHEDDDTGTSFDDALASAIEQAELNEADSMAAFDDEPAEDLAY